STECFPQPCKYPTSAMCNCTGAPIRWRRGNILLETRLVLIRWVRIDHPNTLLGPVYHPRQLPSRAHIRAPSIQRNLQANCVGSFVVDMFSVDVAISSGCVDSKEDALLRQTKNLFRFLYRWRISELDVSGSSVV